MPETVNGDRRWVYETASSVAFSDPETLCPGPSARLPVILDAAAHGKMVSLVRGTGEESFFADLIEDINTFIP